MMPIKFDATIKLDVRLAIEATITVLLAITYLQGNATHSDVQEIKPAVEEIPKEVKSLTRGDLMKIFDRLNTAENRTILNDAQQQQLSKQILREVS